MNILVVDDDVELCALLSRFLEKHGYTVYSAADALQALDILDRAEKARDLRTALAAISQARGNLELLGKLAGELDERPIVNLNISPEWLEAIS